MHSPVRRGRRHSGGRSLPRGIVRRALRVGGWDDSGPPKVPQTNCNMMMTRRIITKMPMMNCIAL